MIDQNHLDLLLELNTDDSQHSGGALIDHLRGTHDFLHEWGNEQAVCLAGLFHSIYGTQYLIEMEAANYLEFMPKSPFTVNELNTFEAKIERGRELLTAPAYDAIKAGIESKRKEISSSREE